MEIYAARQPIFDQNMQVYGYELLYRRSMNNFYEGIDDNQATAELINNAFLTMSFHELTGGTKAFINFSKELLVREIPLLLPKERVVVEVLERVDPTPEIIDACRVLKESGYILALDDFVFQERYRALIELVDIIKIEFNAVSLGAQLDLIEQYRHKITFLAEKIETREQYQRARSMGYTLFQGYFFSKPVVLKSKEIVGVNSNLVRIINELNQAEPDYQKMTEIIEKDLGLSYKLLKFSNTTHFGTRYRIYSIKQALVRIGNEEIRKWVYLMMLIEVQNVDNRELVKLCLVRGKLMELLAQDIGAKQKHFEYFMTGLFSSIDVLLNRRMEEITDELSLTQDVKEALIMKGNDLGKTLDRVLCYETADWNNVKDLELTQIMNKENYMTLYIKALRWAMELEF